MSLYAEIAFNLPIRRNFTYAVPPEMGSSGESGKSGGKSGGTRGAGLGIGMRVTAPFGARALTGLVVGLPESPPEGIGEIRPITRVIDSRPVCGEETLELARWMARMYMCSLGEAVFCVLPGGRREVEMDELPPDEDPRKYELAEQQLSAIKAISSAQEGSFYLFGVTGSGKTDVYLSVAREVTSRGKAVIFLVPEISLTHQVVRIFRSAYGSKLAILHSAMTPSQRLREWLRIMDGEVDIAIGARSAVFAPFDRLGLIVIDEEQEGAYKSNATPRYHARQVAMYRAARAKAILLMGSATPSLEAYQRIREGKLTCLRLPDRLSGGKMPAIETVDMRGVAGPLSPALLEQIARTRAEGHQIILFLNRRGFSYYFHCRSCGYEMSCKHCAVTLTYHKEKERMICHYCGSSAKPITVCPKCGSLDMGYTGYGTEGIEEELKRQFPQLVVRRIDTDSMRKRSLLRQALADFREGKTHMLVGTQMVAKGLDFPGVKLVGIVNADTGLQLPDFRAAERTFSLLVQVSGRAGRSLPDGKVLIQTLRPGAPAIVLAREGKLDEFYEGELEARRQLGFPPYSRLIRLVIRGRNNKKVIVAAGELAERLKAAMGDAGEVLGPVECPIARISGNYRYHALVRTTNFSPAHERTARVLEELRPARGVYVEPDVDPQALL